MWNVINFNAMFKLTNLINVAFSFLNRILADWTLFLLYWIEVSSYYNAFNLLIHFVNQVEILELINNFLNLVLLYCELVLIKDMKSGRDKKNHLVI